MTVTPLPQDPKYASVLPPHFLQGYASAAYQVEGAVAEGGRGPCIWDEWLKDASHNGNDACNSYYLWRDDVELLQLYGANSYRFSVSWNRIKPQGGKDTPVNEEGIKYYNDLIDGLIAAGIEPTITLFHYDTPLQLQKKYRGFAAVEATELVEDFVSYAKVCFQRFGDRVKKWLTINEPWIFTILSSSGLIKDWTVPDFFRVGHNCTLVHAYVAEAYRKEFKYQKGQIGIALSYEWVEPIDESEDAREGARLAEERSLGWFALPIFRGEQTTCWDQYGDAMPHFTNEELKIIHNSADFFSMNHYGTMYATGTKLAVDEPRRWQIMDDIPKTYKRDGIDIGIRGENGHPYIVPEGFRKMLVSTWEKYCKINNIPIIIYENGFPVEGEEHKSVSDIVDDKDRQTFFNGYIKALCDAVVEDGVRMEGYHAWSLLDNLEWNMGYGPRFGVTYVDRKNGFARIPKDSAMTMKSIWEHVIGKSVP